MRPVAMYVFLCTVPAAGLTYAATRAAQLDFASTVAVGISLGTIAGIVAALAGGRVEAMEPSITDAAWWSDLADKLAAAETACRFRGGYSEAEIAALRSAQNTTRLLSMDLRDDEPDERQRLSDTVDRVLRQRAPKGEG